MEGITPVQAKVRSVVTGSTEPYYGETFASTPFASSLKTFLAMTASHGMYLSVGDVGAAFVSTCIDAEGISVIAPPGVVPQPNDPGYDDIMKNKVPEKFWCLLLKKSQYGLKRAPRLFQTALYTTLEAAGFIPTTAEPAIFKKVLKVSDVSPMVYKKYRGKERPQNTNKVFRIPRTNQEGETELVPATILALVHVDDILTSSDIPSLSTIEEDEGGMAQEFLKPLLAKCNFDLEGSRVATDSKTPTFFVGFEIRQSPDRKEVMLGVGGFVKGLVKKILGRDMTEKEWIQETTKWNGNPPYGKYLVPMVPKTMLVPIAEDEQPVTPDEFPYRTVIGASLWAGNVRGDIHQPLRQLARFGLKPTVKHVEAAKHMLRYMWLSADLNIRFSGKQNTSLPISHDLGMDSYPMNKLSHFTSARYGGKVYSVSKGKWVDKSFYKALKGEDPPAEGKIRIDDGDQFHDVDPNHCVYYDSSFQSTFDYRSVSGHVVMAANAAVDFGSFTQPVIAASTMEAEVLATTRGTNQLIHIKTLLEEFGMASPLEPTLSFEDNKAARIILSTPGRRKGAKHFERELARKHQYKKYGYVKYIYCPTDSMLADMFTKPLDYLTFIKFRRVIFNEPPEPLLED